jgi:hypothetical protein
MIASPSAKADNLLSLLPPLAEASGNLEASGNSEASGKLEQMKLAGS